MVAGENVLVSYRPLANLSGRVNVPIVRALVQRQATGDCVFTCCLVLSVPIVRGIRAASHSHTLTCVSRCGAMSDSDSDERQPLPAIHAAVRNLDVDALRRALAAGANVDALDESGRTPLYVACHANPPRSMVTMEPPMWREKVREREAIVAALLRAGANVDARGDETPLKAAVWDMGNAVRPVT